MITLKSDREIQQMAEAGKIIADMHLMLRDIIKPGLDTWEIEEKSRKLIEGAGAIPSQIGFEGFEYATTVSINDEVAHAFPRKGLILKEGDIVTVDTVVEKNGGIADSAWTYEVGNVKPEIHQLVEDTKKAMYLGIDQAIVGNRIGDIGWAIQDFTENQQGYGDVREYIGHGIGPTMHEDPQVPHYGEKGTGLRIQNGMTFTIEPMINLGGWETTTSQEDGWTVTTLDGSWSAQFEHTIAIVDGRPKILTSQDPESDKKYLL